MREDFEYTAKFGGLTTLGGGATLVTATNDATVLAAAFTLVTAYGAYNALKEYFSGIEELHYESTKAIACDCDKGSAKTGAGAPTPTLGAGRTVGGRTNEG